MIGQLKYKMFSDGLEDLIEELHKDSFDKERILKLLKNKNINVADKTGKTLLFGLVEKRKIEAVEFLLKQGLEINVEDNYGKTPLKEAINLNDGLMLRILLEKGANINHVNKLNRTIMQDLAVEGNIKAFKFLMLQEPNLKHKDLHLKNVLFDAIEGERLVIIEEVIHEFTQEDLNSIDIDGKSALFYAVLKKDTTIAERLISYGSDINILDSNNENVLFNAVILGAQNLEIIKMLIKKGINLNQENKEGFTVLEEIIKILSICKQPIKNNINKYRLVHKSNDYLKLASELIKHNVEVNQANKYGKTILQKVVLQKEHEVIDFLIEAGVDIGVLDSNGRTILFDAILSGFDLLDMIAHLIKRGISINHRDKEERTIIDDLVEVILIQENEKKPRHKRFFKLKKSANYFELLRNLFIFNPKINIPKSNGQTIIFELISYNNNELFKFFLNNDIDINLVDRNGQTPLSILVEHGITLKKGKQREEFLDTLTCLLNYNINIDALGHDGRNSLHKAIIADDLEVVEKLILSKKVDTSIKDTQGRTALHHTQWKGNIKIARLLIANGANINEPDDAGYNILNYAAILGRAELVQFLISSGALTYNRNKKDKDVTKFFLNNEADLYKLAEGDIKDEKMRLDILELIENLKNDIHLA